MGERQGLEEVKRPQCDAFVTPTFNKDRLYTAGHLAFNIIETLPADRIKEKWMHGVVIGILEAKAGNMQYEHVVDEGRIDIRHGGTNPRVIEFVLVVNGNEWYANQNKTELRKLSKTSGHYAKGRFLFILAPFGPAIPKEQMERNYREYAGPNQRDYFGENSVRVVYVNPHSEYDFLWSPPPRIRAPVRRRRIG